MSCFQLRVTESELEMFVGSEEKEKIRLQDLQRTLDDVKAEIEEHEMCDMFCHYHF